MGVDIAAAVAIAVALSGALLAWAQHKQKARIDERQARLEEEQRRRDARVAAQTAQVAAQDAALRSLEQALNTSDAGRRADAERFAHALQAERDARMEEGRRCAEELRELRGWVTALAEQVRAAGGTPAVPARFDRWDER